jgi:hypothetical protein
MKWLSKTFFVGFLFLTVLSVLATFYEVVVLQDFDVITEEEIDNSETAIEGSDMKALEESVDEVPTENVGGAPSPEAMDDTGNEIPLSEAAI